MKRIYVSLPISGYDLDERKLYAMWVKNLIKDKYPKVAKVITPFMFAPSRTNLTRTIWVRTSKPCWSAMPSIFVKGGRTPRVVWQSSRWQESMVKK